MTINAKSVFKSVAFWVAVVALCGTIATAYLAYKSSKINAEVEKSKIEMDRLQLILEYQSNELAKERERSNKMSVAMIDQGREIMRLETMLSDKTSQSELLDGFIESLPFPAWIKQKGEDGIFRFITINEQFTVSYGKTKKRMIGKSDYDEYPLDLATEYQRGDKEVHETGNDWKSTVDIIVDGKRKPFQYVKFPLSLPSGFEGIGGMVIDYD